LQRYFIVDLGEGENSKKVDQNQVVQEQLSGWQNVQQQLKEDMQVIAEAVKTNKTS
jgi:hypothetical protein